MQLSNTGRVNYVPLSARNTRSLVNVIFRRYKTAERICAKRKSKKATDMPHACILQRHWTTPSHGEIPVRRMRKSTRIALYETTSIRWSQRKGRRASLLFACLLQTLPITRKVTKCRQQEAQGHPRSLKRRQIMHHLTTPTQKIRK